MAFDLPPGFEKIAIVKQSYSAGYGIAYDGLFRKRLPGGWLVLHESEDYYSSSGAATSSQSMVFVIDPNHVWDGK